MLDSLIRRKRLLLTEVARQLQEALRAKDHSAELVTSAESEHRDSQQYLDQVLLSEESLCVQRLASAKAGESRADQQLARARADYREVAGTVQRFEQRCARLSKDVEKLDEKRTERGKEAQTQALHAEWHRLDEWVTARHGSHDPVMERRADE